MNNRLIYTLIIVCFLFNYQHAEGQSVINVPADYSTIQAAINAAANGDEVVLADGTYYENSISLGGKEIVLKSANGPSNCFVDGNSNGKIFIANSGETFDTKIEGITIQNGESSEGAAIYVISSSYLTVNNCHIKNNSGPNNTDYAPVTIGKAGNSGSRSAAGIKMYDCTFSGNSAYYGGAVLNEENGSTQSEFVRCLFYSNSANRGAAIYSTRNSLISYCLFYSNTSTGTVKGVLHNEGGSPTIVNCTFADNSANAIARNDVTNTTAIINSIFYNNTATFTDIGTPANISITYSNDQDGTSGTGNINSDPKFVGSGDYALQSSSPCINTGDPSSQYNDPDASRNDMGAIHYGGTNVGVLPVTWLSVGAERLLDKSILVKWSTASEYENDYFEVQMLDKDSWIPVGTVMGNGTTTSISEYNYKVENDVAPFVPLYFRIKQVDFNGEFSFSKVISVGSFRSPLSKSSSIEHLIGQGMGNEEVLILNLQGQEIYKGKLQWFRMESNNQFYVMKSDKFSEPKLIYKGILQ